MESEGQLPSLFLFLYLTVVNLTLMRSKRNLQVALVVLLSFLACNSHAQRKIKYKDIFPVLQGQQWDQGEPLLRAYLAQEPEDPNANLQMGFLLDHKAHLIDVLKNPQDLSVLADSAIIYYQKAMQLIDDREIRKHDDYYLAYNRRDLRTGKFAIKLSDIQFDIESKVTALRERVSNVASLNTLYGQLEQQYATTMDLFAKLAKDYSDESHLYLWSNDEVLRQLVALKQANDSTLALHGVYSHTLSAIGDTQYDAEVNLMAITDYHQDGRESTVFSEPSPQVWDYTSWAKEVERVITEEVTPLRDELVEYDVHFSVLYGDLLNGMDISNQLEQNESLYTQLNTLDEAGIPQKLFDYKLQELNYYLVEKELRDPSAMDTVSILAVLDRHHEINFVLGEVEKAFTTLQQADLSEAIKAFPTLMTKRYNGADGFKGFLANRENFLQEERSQLNSYLEGWKRREIEGIWSPDTVIMLAKDSTILGDTALAPGPHTLAIEQFDQENYWVGGMFFNPGLTPTAYVAYFGPERFATWRHQIQLDSFPMIDSLLSMASTFMWKDENIQYVAFYNQTVIEGLGYPSLVARIDEGQLTWQSFVMLDQPIKEVRYREFEEDVKFYLEEKEGQEEGSNFVTVTNQGLVMKPES
ncbi:MAG TPA: hypothetical protein DCE41_06840 [Cytophagales bacterium]|nr:hypothetical protein [Cytophagales bacterium]HAA19939.1 hypothetical protein [Cytophagales bacterium]HAP62634.1 hypothetical protein [Cytophagales bacterium]